MPGLTGSGLNACVATVTSGGSPLPSVLLAIQNGAGAEVAWGVTLANGTATFALDNGTYSVYVGPLSGYGTANPYSWVVSGATNLSIALTAGAAPVYGGMTFANLKSLFDLQLRNKFGKEDDNLPGPVKERMLNIAMREIDHLLRWTQATVDVALVTGTSEYDIPGQVREILLAEFVPVSGVEVVLQQQQQHDILAALGSLGSSTGKPERFGVHGDHLYIYPTPGIDAGDVIRLWAATEPADMVNASDQPAFWKDLHLEVVRLAMAYAISHMGNARDGEERRQQVVGHILQQRMEPAAARNSAPRIRTEGP